MIPQLGADELVFGQLAELRQTDVVQTVEPERLANGAQHRHFERGARRQPCAERHV